MMSDGTYTLEEISQIEKQLLSIYIGDERVFSQIDMIKPRQGVAILQLHKARSSDVPAVIRFRYGEQEDAMYFVGPDGYHGAQALEVLRDPEQKEGE